MLRSPALWAVVTSSLVQKAAESSSASETSIARIENSLYRSVLGVKEAHGVEELGIAFWDAETTIQWSYNADRFFHAASTMKLAVLLAVFRQILRGELTADAPVHVRNKFTSIIERRPFTLELSRDADPEVCAHLGRTMSVERLAYQMITSSSNFATNLLVDVVGVPAIQRALEELRVDGVRVLRGVEDQAAFDAGLNNEVTANGLLRLLRLVADGEAYTPEASQRMRDILLDQRLKTGIPAGLPRDARVAHKTGNISTVHHDAGIVYLDGRKPYVLVILTQFPMLTGSASAVAEVSREIYECLARL